MSLNNKKESVAPFSLDDVGLTVLESRLMNCLMAAPERKLSRQDIFNVVWGYHFDPGTNTLEVLVYRTRKKLVKSPYSLKTVFCYGYQLIEIKPQNKQENN